MKTFTKDKMELKFMIFIEILFAFAIIVMGGYGYYHFFDSDGSSNLTWMIVGLFIVIELSMITMTTVKFSSYIAQKQTVNILLFLAMITMWLIASVGIYQTIWSMLESKYNKVVVNQASNSADIQQQKNISEKLDYLKNTRHQLEVDKQLLLAKIEKSQKLYDKNTRKVNDTIWNNGRNCDSADCLARKKVAQNALDLSYATIENLSKNLSGVEIKQSKNDDKIELVQSKLDDIDAKLATFTKDYTVELNKKQSDGLLHVALMNIINRVFNLNIKEPQRAYVLLLSFIVYPIYILYVMFVASNTSEMKRRREEEQAKKELSKQDKNSNSMMLKLISSYLKKIVINIIKTRKRKVLTKEVIKEMERVVEVEKIIYKDGKEIQKIEVEVPHIIEKEVVVEKIVEKPMVQKELIIVPAGIDLNRLDEFTKSGIVPKELEEFLKENKTQTKHMNFKNLKRLKDDQYSVA